MLLNLYRITQDLSLKRQSLFILCLLLTLAHNHWELAANAGWIIVAIFFAVDRKFAICGLFFYATFFFPTDYLPNLIFSVKHFHIAIVISIIVQFAQGRLGQRIITSVKKARCFAMLFLIIFISMLSSLAHHMSIDSIKIASNFTFVLLSSVYLLSLLDGEVSLLSQGVHYMIGGLAFQLLISLWNSYFGTSYLDVSMTIFHNNHMAVFITFGYFYSLALSVLPQKKYKHFMYLVLMFLFVSGVMNSFARTVWIAFILGHILYIYMLANSAAGNVIIRKTIKYSALVSATFIYLLSYSGKICAHYASRALSYPALLRPHYWREAFQDSNFGFFGAHRLRQFKEIKEIMSERALFGIGMTENVSGFHNLFLTVLGASGLVGTLVFLYYIYTVIHDYNRTMFLMRGDQQKCLILLASLAAMFAWLFSNSMQTLFTQYVIWLNFIVLYFFKGDTSMRVHRKAIKASAS